MCLPDSGALSRLSAHDVAMGWILAAMVAFGVGVGIVFPFLVTPLMNLRPGQEGVFRVACIAAGYCVGGFAYGVARFTLFRANQRLARIAAYDGLTGVPQLINPMVHETCDLSREEARSCAETACIYARRGPAGLRRLWLRA